jgi:flagella basal body P-ring formation protein FlgA
MIVSALLALSACLPAGGGSDRILARDLVAVWPELARVSPETPLAFAPAPGISRIFHLGDLQRLAARWKLESVPEHELCVVRPVSPPDPTRLLAAMQKEMPDAHIEILEYSRRPTPDGSIAFPRERLRHSASGTLWSGWVDYGGNRRFGIWARVAITAHVERVVAVGDLKAGEPIAAARLMAAVRNEYPDGGSYAKSIIDVVGRRPRMRIAAGAEIRTDQLAEAHDVERGDTIRIEVRNGGAAIEFSGEAEASGFVGEKVLVRNPDSQKRFLARVVGKGRVAVEVFASEVKR